MCIACVEYTKDRMTTSELKSALRETTREDKVHFEKVEKLISEYDDRDDLKRELKKLNATEQK